MKKNDVFTVTIEDMGEDGAGIGKTDGYTWFIKDALIGDVIQASVMKMKKNYGFARLVKILEPAPGRVEAQCPVDANPEKKFFPVFWAAVSSRSWIIGNSSGSRRERSTII